jgi:hypothetical protein
VQRNSIHKQKFCEVRQSTPNVTANVCCTWLYKRAVCAMPQKRKLSSDSGDSGSKKIKIRLIWWGLAVSTFVGESEVRQSFCVDAFGKNLPSRHREDDLTLIYKEFSKKCSFNKTGKGNANINCITFQHKKNG